MASTENDIRRRRAVAWGAFWKLLRLWKSSTVTQQLKLDIFKMACLPILLYSCESWVITKSLAAYLNSYLTNCLRIILGIKCLDKVTNNQLYNISQQRPLIHTIQKRQLKWVGHILRKPFDEPLNIYALYLPTHGKCRQGRQPLLYPEYIARILSQDILLSPPEIGRIVQNRLEWGKFVSACCAVDR